MGLQTEKLEESILSKIKELNNRKNELIANAGQLHLDVAELNKIILVIEDEYVQTNKELNIILADLNQKYPNGEINLVEGNVNKAIFIGLWPPTIIVLMIYITIKTKK